jgi:hypothetical protein
VAKVYFEETEKSILKTVKNLPILYRSAACAILSVDLLGVIAGKIAGKARDCAGYFPKNSPPLT